MGHISPLLGIILSLKDKYKFIYFGLENSREEDICKKYDIEFHKMKLLPLYRKNIFKNFKTLYYINKEKKVIGKLYKNHNVKAIISSGGYVSVPLVLAIKKTKKILLESNTSLGVSNKFLSFFVNHIGVQFDTINHKKSILVGNPIIIEKSEFDHPFFYYNEPVILFVGGSNGALEIVELAHKFNQTYPNIKLFVITGEKYYDSFEFNKNVVIYKSIFKLSSILNKFSLIISRAGAATITELLLSESKFILYPSKNVTGNHQMKNAMYLYNMNICGFINDENIDLKVKYIYEFHINNSKGNMDSKVLITDSVERIKKLIGK